MLDICENTRLYLRALRMSQIGGDFNVRKVGRVGWRKLVGIRRYR